MSFCLQGMLLVCSIDGVFAGLCRHMTMDLTFRSASHVRTKGGNPFGATLDVMTDSGELPLVQLLEGKTNFEREQAFDVIAQRCGQVR